MGTIGLPFLRKLGRKVFVFGSLAVDRQTVADQEISQA